VAVNVTENQTERSKVRAARWVLAIAATGVVAGCIVLFFWNPDETGFFPPCVFHQWTGLHCPGCGTLRGLHRLFHGDVIGALRHNLLMVVLIPFVAYAVLADPVRHLAGRQSSAAVLRPIWIWLLFASIVLFAVVRNIPYYPFTLLAPPG